jgi:hypothetical protein
MAKSTKTELTKALGHKLLKGIFDLVQSDEIKGMTSKEPYIRPSMAPGCALKMFIKITNGIEEGLWPDDSNFMMDYYTSVGTTTHSVFQKWFGRTGKLLGNWSCLCKGTKKVKVVHGRHTYEEQKPIVYIKEILPQQTCPHCKAEMQYEEVEIRKGSFSGHLDGILEFNIDGKKIHWIIDFKGTNADKLKRDNAQYPQYPDAKHVKQLSIYTHYLSLLDELNVVGWALLYTSRDTPIPKYKIIPHVMSKADWKEAEMLFESQVKQTRILYKSLEDGSIKRILKHKLCEDHRFYKRYVSAKYHECELADICFSAPKQLQKMLKDAQKKLVLPED